MSTGDRVARVLGRAVATGLRSGLRSALRSSRAARPARPARQQAPSPGGAAGPYAGDFTGTASVDYAPRPDGDPDPGEVVWGWVPYEEDHSRGKDRPALVVGRDGPWLLALMLTSRDHDRDAGERADEERHGRVWLDVGTGAWDSRRRPSEVRLDRVLRLDPGAVRREGAALDRARFDRVAQRLRSLHGWT